MPGIAPIRRAWRYAEEGSGCPCDVTTRLAPPYDLVTPDLRTRLLAADARCSVAIDVPHLPVNRVGPDAAYAAARRTFEAWVQSRVLRPFEEPVFGLLRQTVRDGPYIVRRHAILAEVPLTSLGAEAGLYAHEETGSGPRGDRLALLRALRVQTSPVFGLYSDEGGSVEEIVRRLEVLDEPRLVGMGTDHALCELWLVEDGRTQEALAAAFGRRDVIIADGHHRYASHLAWLESLGGGACRAARSCLFALVAQEDPGMSIRAVHHLIGGIAGFRIDAVAAASNDLCRIEEVEGGPADLLEHLQRAWFERSHPIGLVDYATRRCFVMTTREIDPLAAEFPRLPESWRRAEPVVCEHLLVQRTLRDRLNGGRPPVREAVFDVADLEHPNGRLPGAQLGIVMLPVSLADVLAMAPGGWLLPPDSTFFWPKMPTGLVFKSLE